VNTARVFTNTAESEEVAEELPPGGVIQVFESA